MLNALKPLSIFDVLDLKITLILCPPSQDSSQTVQIKRVMLDHNWKFSTMSDNLQNFSKLNLCHKRKYCVTLFIKDGFIFGFWEVVSSCLILRIFALICSYLISNCFDLNFTFVSLTPYIFTIKTLWQNTHTHEKRKDALNAKTF